MLAYSGIVVSATLGDHANRELVMARIDEYVKIAEAARFLGVSQNTLRAWAATGKIPVRVNPANNYRLFRREDLKRFLQRVEQSAQKPRKPR